MIERTDDDQPFDVIVVQTPSDWKCISGSSPKRRAPHLDHTRTWWRHCAS